MMMMMTRIDTHKPRIPSTPKKAKKPAPKPKLEPLLRELDSTTRSNLNALKASLGCEEDRGFLGLGTPKTKLILYSERGDRGEHNITLAESTSSPTAKKACQNIVNLAAKDRVQVKYDKIYLPTGLLTKEKGKTTELTPFQANNGTVGFKLGGQITRTQILHANTLAERQGF